MNHAQFWGGGPAAPFSIDQSLRFNKPDLNYLSRTPSSAGNREKYTISMWVKRGQLGFSRLIGAYVANNYMEIVFNGNDKIVWYHYLSGFAYHKITSPVYRDCSAWMHLMFVFDSNNTTADDRMKIYVNGQRITTFDTSVNPSSGFDDQWNNTSPNVIGDLLYNGSPANSFDGYMAEVHHIDGTAAAVTDFGETDTDTGAWIPKRYSGSYGTNGFYLPWSNATIGTDLTATATISAPFGGTAENARTNDTSYLISNTSTGSGFTLFQQDFGSVQQLSRYEIYGLYFTGGTSTFQIQYSNNASSWTNGATLSVTATGQNFSGNFNFNARYVRLQATAFGVNGTGNINALIILQDSLGADASGNDNHWNVSNFSVTAGAGNDVLSDTPTNNWCTLNPLDSDPARPSTVGLSNGNLDASISTYSGVQYVMRAATFASNGKDYFEVRKGDSVNKRMYVGFIEAGSGERSGAGSGGLPYDFYGYGSGDTVGTTSGFALSNTSTSATGLPTIDPGTLGDILMVAHDRASKKIWFGKNGTWFTIGGTVGNPATGTAPAITYTTDSELLPCIGAGSFASTTIRNLNFGQRPFSYTPPTGFSALNSQNLPEPAVKNGTEYFDVIAYEGNGASSQTVTGTNFKADLSWVKNRDGSDHHVLQDSVRGITQTNGNQLTPNETFGQNVNGNGHIGTYNSNGFIVEDGTSATFPRSAVNNNNTDYIAWLWKAGGDSNTFNKNGTGYTSASSVGLSGGVITPTRGSLDTTAGISIIRYTGNNSGAASIFHGLGAAPKFIVAKSTDGSQQGWGSWVVGHDSVGWGDTSTLVWNENYAKFDGYQTTPWGNISPNYSAFYVGFSAGAGINSSQDDYIAYVFKEVEGFSKFSTYQANSNSNGPFVYCGFKPAWVLIKAINMAQEWIIVDNKRPNTQNPVTLSLRTEVNLAEGTGNDMDFLSNGFKIRTSGSGVNYNTGQTYMFAAFAERPFKYANAQ